MKSRKMQASRRHHIYFFKTKADILINVVAEEVGAGAQDYHLEDADTKKASATSSLAFTWQFFGKMRYLGKQSGKSCLRQRSA
jgi:hypothetical protein